MTDPDDSSSPFRERAPLSIEDGLKLVETAELELLGRMPWSSNATFLCDLQVGSETPAQAIYKPAEGEQPLRDFPSGLHRREVASFRLSQQLGWDLVPPTVERDDHFGPGSVQLYIPADYDEHYFTMLETGAHNEQFKLLCAFDVVANSTDRKGGHCLLGQDGRIWAIDNGLSFHEVPKLRTVIWEWSEEPVPVEIREQLAAFCEQGLAEDLAELLSEAEQEATIGRARALVNRGTYPVDLTGRAYPWPLV
jgi:uncharacterized repeat protein (TIGR03843 family)